MKMKLLVHVNESEKWPAAVGNIANFLTDVGDENAEVIVVANGAGVRGYLRGGPPQAERQGDVCIVVTGDSAAATEGLEKRGVLFIACANALRAQHIEAGSLPAFVRVVPAGVTEIVKRQAEGFAYVKP